MQLNGNYYELEIPSQLSNTVNDRPSIPLFDLTIAFSDLTLLTIDVNSHDFHL